MKFIGYTHISYKIYIQIIARCFVLDRGKVNVTFSNMTAKWPDSKFRISVTKMSLKASVRHQINMSLTHGFLVR